MSDYYFVTTPVFIVPDLGLLVPRLRRAAVTPGYSQAHNRGHLGGHQTAQRYWTAQSNIVSHHSNVVAQQNFKVQYDISGLQN